MKNLHDYLLKQSFWDSGDNFSFINHKIISLSGFFLLYCTIYRF